MTESTRRYDVRVGINESPARGYSTEWRDGDSYDELDQLRALSRMLGRDDGNLLAGIVEPGQDVVIKPNWVLDSHPRGLDPFSMITHSSVLRAVVDLAYEALRGEGTITIADAPQWNCDFDNLLRVTEVERIRDYYGRHRGFYVGIVDLRQVGTVTDGVTRVRDRRELPGDPKGYAVVDLGRHSAFEGMPHIDRIYGADYDRSETRLHHNETRHEYLISRTVLGAHTFVHVPKLKVHKRVGVTLNAKGMVGINGHKNWIAHYRVGPPSAGGDEYPDELAASARVRNRLGRLAIDHLLAPRSRSRERLFGLLQRGYRALKPVLGPFRFTETGAEMPEGGNWHGNDTAWRMTADLARAAVLADVEGVVHDVPQRRFVSIVDGIVAGEGEGPLAPDPRPSGVLIAGTNLLAVDLVGTRLMGFDWRRVRSLRWLLEDSPQFMGVHAPEEIEVVASRPDWEKLMVDEDVEDLAFAPHPQWVGHLEQRRSERVPA
jgi:uncharacterized protein (DUF362 family)